MRLSIVLLLGASLVLSLSALPAGAQEPAEGKPKEDKKPKKKTPAEIDFGEPGAKIEDANAARQEITRFQKEFKANRKDEAKCVELLQRLGRWDHPLILKEAKKLIRHKSFRVAVEAVRVCVRQTSEKAKTGSTLFKALRGEKRTDVRCALIVGMGVLGYDHASAKKEVYNYFRRDTTETHKAAARYLGYIKDKEAFRMLAERLDEPRPARVDDPKNPPASWWRARWEEWNANLPHIQWAISQLVPGESFETKKEAEEWARTEGKKHGIKW